MHSKAIELNGARRDCAGRTWVACMLLGAACIWLALPESLAQSRAAADASSVYTAEVSFDRSEPEPNRSAYQRALMIVLVRLTGSLEVAESEEVMSLFPNPDRFVRQRRPGPDSTLVVSFYGEEIERLLRQTGVLVWSADRPLTVVWLAVDWGKGRRELIGSDQQRPLVRSPDSIEQNKLLRERVETVAEQRGVPVVFPLLDAEDLENVAFSDVWGGFDEQLVTASGRYGATSVLVGRMRPGSARAHRWTWYRDGQRAEWRGEPEEAIARLADSLAASDALPGNQAGEITQLNISGIDSVHAYGRVQNYLEGLRVLDALRILTVTADRITYDVEVRGGAERLRTALARSGFLTPADYSLGIATDAFRNGRSANDALNNEPLDNEPVDNEPVDNGPSNRGPIGNRPANSRSANSRLPGNRAGVVSGSRALDYVYVEATPGPLTEASPRN